jgi:hypothetical protein
MSKSKIEELRGICAYFNPHTTADGKTTCSHRFNEQGLLTELCYNTPITGNFLCEILHKKKREAERNRMSQSRVGTFLSCPLKYRLKYVDVLKPEEFPAWSILGNTFHNCIANMENNRPWHMAPKPPPGFTCSDEQWETLRIVLEYWDTNHLVDRYPRDGRSEVEFKIQAMDSKIKLYGFVDGWNEPEAYLVERKYSAAKNYNTHTMMRQVGTYFYAFPKAKACHVLRTTKPALRLAKSESMEAYKVRVRAKVKELDEKRELVEHKIITRFEIDIARVIHDIEHVAKLIRYCEKHDTWPGAFSPMSCPDCDMLSYCTKLAIIEANL